MPNNQDTTPVSTAQVHQELMIPSGPFSESWRLYQAAGWLGTLRLPKLSKSPVPVGFTGRNGEWPDEQTCVNWGYTTNSNIGIRLPEGVIGIDVDHGYEDKNGRVKCGADDLARMESELGVLPATWTSTSRGTGRSRIHFFRVPEGVRWPTELSDDIEIIQFDHRYAVVWPSIVEDKYNADEHRAYRWYNPEGEAIEWIPRLEELAELPASWVTHLRDNSRKVSDKVVLEDFDYPEQVRFPDSSSEITNWLDRMLLPKDDPGRGDDSATSVAGGIVRMCIDHGLPFKVALAVAYNYDQGSDDPQHRRVILDKVSRMWAQDKATRRAQAVEDFREESGYLMDRQDGCGYIALANNRFGKPEEVPFSDFRVHATGVHTENGKTTWTLDLERKDGKVFRDVELTSDVLASPAALRQWAMGYRCSIFFSADKDVRGHAGTRLQALMESQKPIDCRVISHLGWDDQAQGFVTYQGLITADGVDRFPSVRPSRDLVSNNLVNHHYGFQPESEVVDVLKEVLTFHDETFTSVFTSWMVAGTLKGQFMKKSSLFPIFMVEAVSESGKTKGFSQLVSQMWGNLSAEGGISTTAATRDALAAHRGAPVHIDDADSLKHVEEILRQATVEGTVDKKGGDFRGTVRSRLLAPVWISCENSGLHGEKALPDRMIRASLPSPKGRMSRHNPEREQWYDILEMMDRYSGELGLTVLSGTLTQMILKRAHLLDQFEKLAKGSGRFGDKMAVLRVGARILADITGDESHIRRVDEWTASQVDTGAENALTLKLIPAAINVFGIQNQCVRIDSAPHYGFATPIIVSPAPGDKDGTNAMWVHTASLAGWWEKQNHGKVSHRTETVEALDDQAKALGMVGRSAGVRNKDWAQFNVSTTNLTARRQRILYQRVPDSIAQRILAAHGTELGDEEEVDFKRLNPAQVVAIDRARNV